MKRGVLIFALGFAACGPSVEAPTQESIRAEAASPIAAQTSGEPCGELAVARDDAGMETLGVVSGYTISATRGVLACSEPALGSVECAATGPGEVHVSAGERIGYALSEGQTAAFVVTPEGPSCVLNVSGG